ncbi:MAG: NTP transferase domain-containing protein [Actinobacteria bacterium]|nr:NTP transferase domain-containing protein [Actinomycetota bacterium]
MKSDLPKMLHPVCGRPMLHHVLAAARAVDAERTVVVLGHGADEVMPHLPQGCTVALQERQGGTGHALLSAEKELLPGAALILPGDTPLLTGDVLRHLVDEHMRSGAAATVLTVILEDPTGYGRIVRGPDGAILRVVEHRDATPEEHSICEVNTGMYVLPIPGALDILRVVGADNDQGEIYLTDVVAGLVNQGERVSGIAVSDPSLVLGVNSRVELAEAERLLGNRIKNRWMLDGVSIVDPASTVIEVGVTLAPEVVIKPFTVLAGRTIIGTRCEVGPCSTVIDSRISEKCSIPHCFVKSTTLEPGTSLAPFTAFDGDIRPSRVIP